MKKIPAAIVLFSMLFFLIPFVLQAQNQAKVTVTIKSLQASTVDACIGEMDFFGKIIIGGKVKSFPVHEGNNLQNLNWQYTTTLNQEDFVKISIEIWDDDDAACGGKDDRVCVDDHNTVISKTYSTRENNNQDFSSRGSCRRGLIEDLLSDVESALIVYNITIELTKTGFLTDGTWKLATKEIKRGSGPWEELIPSFPACENDNLYEFRKTGAYEINEGTTKCSPADPQTKNGNWAFQLGESRIRLTLAGVPTSIIYKVDEIGKNLFRLISLPTVTGGVLTYTRITYRHY
jgi:hypothetical protein